MDENDLLTNRPSEKENIPKPKKEVELTERGDLQSQIYKLRNQIKHMEFNIDQNRKRGETIAKDCEKLLRVTELLCFDLVFTNYLFGLKDVSEVYSYFDRCIHPEFNLSSGKDRDYILLGEHITYLQNLISNSIDALIKSDVSLPEIPKRTSEFVLYLRDQQMRLEKEIHKSDYFADLKSGTNEGDEKLPELEDLPCGLVKWLNSEMHERIDQDDSYELRALIGSVTKRLGAIIELQEHIIKMRSEYVNHEDLDYNYSDPEDLFKSSFFIALNNCCNFLLQALNCMKLQIPLLSEYNTSLQKITDDFTRITSSTDNLLNEMKAQIAQQQSTLSETLNSIDLLKKETQPIIDSVFSIQFAQVPEFNEDQYTQIIANLNNIKLQNPEISSKVGIVIGLINSVHQTNKEIHLLCTEQDQLIRQQFETDKNEFRVEFTSDIEQTRNESKDEELKYILQYTENLKNLVESMKQYDISAVSEQITGFYKHFSELINQTNIAAAQTHVTLQRKELETRITAKRQEINLLSIANYQMCGEIGKSKFELQSIQEELLNTQQQLESINSYIPETIDRSNKHTMKKFKHMVFCPICKTNRRDTILSTCSHALCHSCLSENQDKCPICSKCYSPNDMKPFYIQ